MHHKETQNPSTIQNLIDKTDNIFSRNLNLPGVLFEAFQVSFYLFMCRVKLDQQFS
jgi:hypothetical protein